MLRENSAEILNAWGADILKFAKINLGDKNRKRKSTLTGKTYKKRIDNTGELRKSLDKEFKQSENSFSLSVTGLDYGDVVDGGRRKGKGIPLAPLTEWAKRINFRENGKNVERTLERREAFAGFVSWKAKKYGIAPTYFMRDAVRDASKKHEKELFPAYFKDVEQSIDFIIGQLQANRIQIDLKF